MTAPGAIYAQCQDAADDNRNALWLHGLMENLTPLATGAYVGLCDLDRPGGHLPTHSAATTQRLADLRGRMDPGGLFTPALVAPALAAE